MGDRMDEFKGNIKEGVGKMSGNTEMEAEGKADHDTAHASREIKGAGNQAVGGIKEGVGKLTGDEETRAEGKADRFKGDTQRAG